MSKVGLLFKLKLINLCLTFRIIKNKKILANIQNQGKIIIRMDCIMKSSFKDHNLLIPILGTIIMVGNNNV